MGKILGIDLGTTNSAMAVLEGGSPTIIVNAEGDRTTPSVVGFRADGDRVVGKAAKNQAVTNPKNTVFSIKRFMGRRYDEVTSELKTIPYKVKAGTGFRGVVEIEGEDFTPEQISAMILSKMKADAEKYLGETVTDAGFIEAVLRIWVGPKPVDSQLKSSLLGAPPKTVDTNNLG